MTISIVRITAIVIGCKFIITLVSFITSILIKSYDTTLSIPYHLNEKEWLPLDKPTLTFLGMFSNWDGTYFTYLSSHSYSHDQFYAFFPFYPFVIGLTRDVLLKPLLDRNLVSIRPASILAAGIVGTIANIIAAWSLLRLTWLIFFFKENRYLTEVVKKSPPIGPFVSSSSSPLLRGVIESFHSTFEADEDTGQIEDKVYFGDSKYAEVFATFCVTLFCLGPGGVFFSANYTEALFAALTFSGLYHVEKAIVNLRKLKSCHLNVSNNYRITSIVSQNETVAQLYKLAQNETNTAFLEGRYDLLRGGTIKKWADYRIIMLSVWFMLIGLVLFIMASATRSNGLLNLFFFAWGVIRMWETYCDSCNTVGEVVGVQYPTIARIRPRDIRQRVFRLGMLRNRPKYDVGIVPRDPQCTLDSAESSVRSQSSRLSTLRRRRGSASVETNDDTKEHRSSSVGESGRNSTQASETAARGRRISLPRERTSNSEVPHGRIICSERTFFATRTMQLGPPGSLVWIVACLLLGLSLLIAMPSALIQWHAAFRFCGPAPKYLDDFYTYLGSDPFLKQDGSWTPPVLPETSLGVTSGQQEFQNPIVYDVSLPLPEQIQTPQWCPSPKVWNTLFPEQLSSLPDAIWVIWRLIRPPPLYKYIQKRYWGVEFLGYWKAKHILQFLLASPMLLLCVLAILMFLDSDQKKELFSIPQALTRIIRGSYITPLLSCSPLPAIPVPLSEVVSTPSVTSPRGRKEDIVERSGTSESTEEQTVVQEKETKPPYRKHPLARHVVVPPVRKRKSSPAVRGSPLTATEQGRSATSAGSPTSETVDEDEALMEGSDAGSQRGCTAFLPNAGNMQADAFSPVGIDDFTRGEETSPQFEREQCNLHPKVQILDHVVYREELIQNARSTLRSCVERTIRCFQAFLYPVARLFLMDLNKFDSRPPAQGTVGTSSGNSIHALSEDGVPKTTVHALQPKPKKKRSRRNLNKEKEDENITASMGTRGTTISSEEEKDIFHDIVFVQGTYDGYSSRVLQEEFRPNYGVPIFHIYGPELIETDTMRTGALFVRKYYLLFPYLLHWLFIAIFGATFMHVNVLTRLCSASNPAVYWTLGELWMITHRTLSISRRGLARKAHAKAVSEGALTGDSTEEATIQNGASSPYSIGDIINPHSQDSMDAKKPAFPLRSILASQRLVFRFTGVDISIIRFLIVMWISTFTLLGTILFSKFYNWT